MARICLDGFNLAIPQGSGIASYGRNLLDTINRTGHSAQVLYGMAENKSRRVSESRLAEGDVKPFKPRKSERYVETLTARFGRSPYFVPTKDHVIWDERTGGKPPVSGFWFNPSLFNYAARSFSAYGKMTPVEFKGDQKPDIMHWTCPLPLWAKNIPNIVTFHDLIPLILPHSTGDDKVRYAQLCTQVAERADHIVAVSEKTADDVCTILGVPESKISVTYQAAYLPQAVVPSQASAMADVDGIFELNWKGYFIHYGSVEPKKNLGRIVEAYLSSKVDLPLVLVGGRAWLEKNEIGLLNQIRAHGLSSSRRIIQYDYLPRRLLASLIMGSRSVVFPSLYEGFGLPVVEAMSLNTSVITSSAGSLPEVAGDAAYICDPYDIDQLATAFKDMAGDLLLAEHYAQLGLHRAKTFSQEAYDQKISALYARY